MIQQRVGWHGLNTTVSEYNENGDYSVDLTECLQELKFTREQKDMVYSLFVLDISKMNKTHTIPLRTFVEILIGLSKLPRNYPYSTWDKGDLIDHLIQKAILDCFKVRPQKRSYKYSSFLYYLADYW